MKSYIAFITIMTLNITCICLAGEPVKLPHILKELESGRNKKYDEAYADTLDILTQHPDMPKELLNAAIDILLFHPQNTIERFPILQYRETDVDKAIIHFDTIPGFRPLLVKVIQECCTCSDSKIYSHVLGMALFLRNQINGLKDSEKITAFGLPADFGTTRQPTRFYNIITNQRWIECKATKWRFNSFNRRGKKKKPANQSIARAAISCCFIQ